ncbi:putative RNA-binding domain superfamily [Helianthus annuus]|nr:putative RNA-binding domain superfamily [Helianthus annuus]KAJ0697998.1 putative RNA-binding domain superfamily [Helianthus annuus]
MWLGMGSERRRKPIPVNVQRRLTKFFVSNLPVRCSGSDLAGYVRVHEEIYDIYIARKRDNMGNQFGFVSLLDVKNTGEMEKALSTIRIGDYKLCFNVARFTLEDVEINNRQSEKFKAKSTSEPSDQPIGRKVSSGVTVVGTKSFKDAVVGTSNTAKEEKVIVVHEEFKAYDHVMGKAVISRMVNFKALTEAGETIKDLTSGKGVVQYVGGMFIIVSFKSGMEMERFFALVKEKEDVFQWVEKWVGQTLSFERVAWLRIQGIPLHLLDNSVINSIGESFGKIVQGGQHDVGDADLSFDYVSVLVTEGRRIQEEVVVQWKGRKYRVWVEEEVGDWEPDFQDKPRGEVEASVNRSDVLASDFPAGPTLIRDMEGPIITEILDEEGNVIEKGNDILEKIENNLDVEVEVDKVSNVKLRRPNKEDMNFGCDRRFLSKKEGKNRKRRIEEGWAWCKIKCYQWIVGPV